MTRFMMGAAKFVFFLLGMRTKPLGTVLSVLLVWMSSDPGCINDNLWTCFQNYVSFATLNLVCNNLNEFWCMYASANYV